MTLVMTMILGIVGSFVGGFISYMFGFDPEEGALQPSGMVMSIVDAIVVVWVSLYEAAQSVRGKIGG